MIEVGTIIECKQTKERYTVTAANKKHVHYANSRSLGQITTEHIYSEFLIISRPGGKK